jgi:hypothetical protein
MLSRAGGWDFISKVGKRGVPLGDQISLPSQEPMPSKTMIRRSHASMHHDLIDGWRSTPGLYRGKSFTALLDSTVRPGDVLVASQGG